MKKVRDQFADTMLEVGQRDQRLAVLIGDVSHHILQPFAKACPGRFYNIGICEPTMVSMAAGLAKVGFYPVVHTIAPFMIERSFEQIKLDFCYQKLQGALITIGGAFDYSNLGCTHHCYSDFAMLKSLPYTQVIHPASCDEFDIIFKQTYNDGKLTLFRIPAKQHEQPIDPSLIQIGKAVRIKEGKDITVVVTGSQLKNAMGAQKELLGVGCDMEIIYIHTIWPLDIDMIRKSVEKTRKVLVIEEHNRLGGLGSDIIQNLYNIEDLQFQHIAIDPFIRDYGTYDSLCNALGFSVAGIKKVIQNKFKKDNLCIEKPCVDNQV